MANYINQYGQQVDQFGNTADFYKNNKLTVKPAKKKNETFLTNLIPTVGGTGGALGGAALGASLGSVVPVLGTAAGGLIGALLGGTLGSGAGKIGENAIEGADNLAEGVGKEALLGGVTSLPFGAGVKLARAGVKAATGVGKTAAKDLVQDAGIATIGKGTANRLGLAPTGSSTSLVNNAGKSLERKSNQMLASQTGMTNAQARRSGVGSQVDTFGNINRRTGLTSLDDMAAVSQGLTGGKDSLLDTLTRSSVESSKGVAVNDLRKSAQDLIDNKGSLLSDSERKNILRNVKNASTTMFGGSKGSLSTLANPTSALDQANAFRATAREISNAGLTATPAQKQTAKIYDNLAGQLEKSIYSSPGVGESLPTLLKAGRDDLLLKADDMAAAGLTAQANAYRKVAQELGNVKDIKGLRSMKKDFVDISKIDRATGQAEGSRTLGGRDLTNNASSMVRNPLNLLAAPLDAATPRIAGKTADAARRLQGGGLTAAAGQGVLPLALRQGTGRLLTADEGVDPTLDEASLAQQDMTIDPTGAFSQQQEAPAEASNPFGVSAAELGQGLMRAYAAGDKPAIAQLQNMYDLATEYEKNNGGQDLNATAQKSLAQSSNGLSTLDQLEAAFNQAGGGQGKILGNVNKLIGNATGSPVATYNSLAGGSVAQIAKALGETGALSDSDIKAYTNLIPQVTNSPEQAAALFAALRQRLQAAAQNTAQYGTGASDLSSLIAQ